MYVASLDDDFAAVEPLPSRVVEVVLRDDDGQDGHARVLGNDSLLLIINLPSSGDCKIRTQYISREK